MSIKDKLTKLFSKKEKAFETKTSISEAFHATSSSTTKAPIRKSLVQKPTFEKYYPYLISAFIAYAIADLVILKYRPDMLPTQPPPMAKAKQKSLIKKMRSEYNVITTRNIFNSDGEIPDPMNVIMGEDGTPGGVLGPDGQLSMDGPVEQSELPLKLVGTIVHVNPAKSVAAVQIKNQNIVIPYMANDDMEGLAELLKIERRKIFIRNTSSGRLEYIEIPNDTKLTLNIASPKSGKVAGRPSGGGFAGETSFTMGRAEVDKMLKDLPNLLQQARAVPNIVPGSGGEVDGFKMVEIEPDSIFATKLGLKVNDVIKGVNGEDVNSPAKAMELYNALKTSNNVEIKIERGGQEVFLNYNIE